MATVGQQLTAPEAGWRRYDQIDSRIIFQPIVGNPKISANESLFYGGTTTYLTTPDNSGGKILFKFKGTKLRLIQSIYNDRSANISIKIDGVTETYSEYSSTYVHQVIVYEKIGLTDSVHTVEISSSETFGLDAIDIDADGKLLHPYLPEKFDLKEMETGDVIACRYTASSNGVGVFSELGTCTANEIPVGGSSSPDGLFYFIHVGYDHKGRKKLVADRNIQHSISWDALNNEGIVQGVSINKLGYINEKLADPSDPPPSDGYGVSFSPDGVYLAVASDLSPYLTIYKRSGDTFTKLSNPSVLPTGTGSGIVFSPDGTYLAISHGNSPFITIYKRSGDTFTKLPNPSVLPTGFGAGAAFSPNGTYLAIAHGNSPYLTIYKRSGDTFTKLSNPSVLPTGAGYGITFSPDGTYLVIAHNNSPYLTIYKRSGDTFTKLSNPSVLPTGAGRSPFFSPDGLYLAVAHDESPYLAIYKRSGDTFTKLSNPSVLPTNQGRSATFSPDGRYLITGGWSKTYVYRRSGDTFTCIDSTALPSGGRSLNFSSNGEYLAVGSSVSPYLTIYKKSTIFNDPLQVITVKLLEGGVHPTDKENEWDYIIGNNTLNGLITAGDNSIWNWSGIASWSSTIVNGDAANRVIRGNNTALTHSNLASNTANATTGFRPLLLWEPLNEPPTDTLDVDRLTTHNNDVTISGEITDPDGDEVSYRILLNGVVIQDWIVGSIVNYPIDATSLNIGINTITLEYTDMFNPIITKSWEITKTNTSPLNTLEVNRVMTYDESVILSGIISDLDGDKIKYRVIKNGVASSWSSLLNTPVEVNIEYSANDFYIGENTLLVEILDEFGGDNSANFVIRKKSLDSTYVNSANPDVNYFNDTVLKIGGEYITLIQMELDERLGYLKSASMILTITSQGTGTVKVAKILQPWDALEVTYNTLPNIDTDGAVDYLVELGETIELDVSHAGFYGVAIYSNDLQIEATYSGNTVTTIYQPTELNYPEEIFANRVLIEWKEIITPKPEAYLKTTLMRSKNPDFSNETQLLEVHNKEVLKYIDTTVEEGTYYYRVAIHYVDNVYNGNQLDFDFEDRSLFFEEDSVNGTDFVDGVVTLRLFPKEVVNIDCNSDDGFEYDSNSIEFLNGRIQLLPLE